MADVKKEWVRNALAAAEGLLCPALCLAYVIFGAAVWSKAYYLCPVLALVLAALIFSGNVRRLVLKCVCSVCLTVLAFILAYGLRWWNWAFELFNPDYGRMNAGTGFGIAFIWTPSVFIALAVAIAAGCAASLIIIHRKKLQRGITMLIRELEEKMWRAAQARDKAAFLELVDENAVMVCGGFRCSGAEYAGMISEFDCASFVIEGFETVCETPDMKQVHYVITTTAGDNKNADLSGKFHVTSTWRNSGGSWKLVFNMDSRIFER